MGFVSEGWGSRVELSRRAQKERPRFLGTTIAAIALVLSGLDASAEDEPGARAPLPPPLQSAPAQSGERPISASVPDFSRPKPGQPAIAPDRGRPPLSQKKFHRHPAPYHGASPERRRSLGPSKTASMNPRPNRHGHLTVASAKKERRDPAPTGPAIGELSPSPDYTNPEIGRAGEIRGGPRPALPGYYPGPFAGPPAYGYAPNYPFAWAPPGPMMTR